ncbi:uncharacterized protein [Vulpes vulpes]|uniref:Uncharacterized protein isoform X1 n=1 Tax=Vulpes vulpes TaxID=9627 RepID=A0ABM5B231_VULVU
MPPGHDLISHMEYLTSVEPALRPRDKCHLVIQLASGLGPSPQLQQPGPAPSPETLQQLASGLGPSTQLQQLGPAPSTETLKVQQAPPSKLGRALGVVQGVARGPKTEYHLQEDKVSSPGWTFHVPLKSRTLLPPLNVCECKSPGRSPQTAARGDGV